MTKFNSLYGLVVYVAVDLPDKLPMHFHLSLYRVDAA